MAVEPDAVPILRKRVVHEVDRSAAVHIQTARVADECAVGDGDRRFSVIDRTRTVGERQTPNDEAAGGGRMPAGPENVVGVEGRAENDGAAARVLERHGDAVADLEKKS